MKNTMLYMLLAFGLMSSCAKEEIPTPENEPTTPEIAYTEGELLVSEVLPLLLRASHWA